MERFNFRPTSPALALATRITPEIYSDVYRHAEEIDKAFAEALERTREEERQRILNMGFVELCREFWKDRKLRATADRATHLQGM